MVLTNPLPAPRHLGSSVSWLSSQDLREALPRLPGWGRPLPSSFLLGTELPEG